MSIADKLLTVANNTRSVAEKVNAAKTTASGNPVVLRNTVENEPVEIKLSSKNLFNIADREVRDFGALSNTTQRNFTENSVYLNVACNNYCNVAHGLEFEIITESSFTVLMPTAAAGGWQAYGAAFNFKVKPNTAYAVSASFDTTKGKILGFGCYDESGSYISSKTTTNITTPDNCVWVNVIFGVLLQGEAVLFENVQLEENTTATEYTPYTTDFTDMEVVATGKNLFNISLVASSGGITNNQDGTLTTDGGTILHQIAGARTLQQVCPELRVGDVATLSANSPTNAPQYIYLTLVKRRWTFGQSLTITQEMLDSGVYLYNSKLEDGTYLPTTISNIQIELGTTATEYEPYKEPQTALAAADGTVQGITAYSPTTTLHSINDAAVINVKYFPESAADTLSKYRAIKQKMQTLSDSLKEE